MARVVKVISDWGLLVEEFNVSATAFYDLVREGVKRREIPGVKCSLVEWPEGGIGSARRKYFRVRRRRLAFDICAAPFGKSYFFSWWLAELDSGLGIWYGFGALLGLAILFLVILKHFGLLIGPIICAATLPALFILGALLLKIGFHALEDAVLEIPVLGWLYRRFFAPTTYFTLDTQAMFRESVRAAVNEAVNVVKLEKGLRSLSAEEKKPRVRDLADSGKLR